MTILITVTALAATALAAPLVTRAAGRWAGWVLSLPPAVACAYFVSLLPAAQAGRPLAESARWVAAAGLHLNFRADGLSLLFGLLITGIGALVVIYAGGYLAGHPALGRFYAWLFVFMTAMVGLAFADNLLLLFVFWELTSLSSYMLIGFENEKASARNAALQALLVTGSGGLALLAGLILLGQAGGADDFSVLTAHGAASLKTHPLYAVFTLLLVLGAFTKSAQFPFHFWLPNAMEAPTPVSAYLHSATMVKAGVYLLARLFPLLGDTPLWQYVVGGGGAATLLAGACLALPQTDLKRLLAYSTVSALGLLVLLIGLGSHAALEAAMVFLLAHALYKGAMFLVAGSLDHETGTRDVTLLGGLLPAMRITGTAALLAAISMAGLPPLFGFIAKELAYEAALDFGPVVMGAVIAGGLASVYVAGSVALGPFLGKQRETPRHPHEAPPSLWLGPVVLGVVGLVVGAAPSLVGGPLLSPAAAAAIGEPISLKLALWHGITPALLLSLGTVAFGLLLYAVRHRLRAGLERLDAPIGPARLYGWLLDAVNSLARWQTGLLQSGYLRRYLVIIMAAVTGVTAFTLLTQAGLPLPPMNDPLVFYEAALGLLIVLAAIVATASPSRLGAVAALGVAGYGVSLLYLIFGAPDLAMTQFLIESLTVILFVLVFYHLPRFNNFSSWPTRVRDWIIAGLAGALVTGLVLSAASGQLSPSIAEYFVQTSLPEAHGRNIVNVILVDFRGIDTLGEITVLGIAAIGVFALLKLRPGAAQRDDGQGEG